jgi:hypothetical protein
MLPYLLRLHRIFQATLEIVREVRDALLKKSSTFTSVVARFDSRVARICPPLPSSSDPPMRC